MDRLVGFGTCALNVVEATPSGGSDAISLPPSLGSFLKNDTANTTPTGGASTIFVSNQNRGNGSGSSAENAKELTAAFAIIEPGGVLRAVAQTAGSIEFWSYPSGISPPTGNASNYITLEARQGDGIVLSRAQDFAGARTPNSGFWNQTSLSQADIDKQIWRSASTFSGGAQRMFGFWIEFDHPHQLVSAGSMTNLRATYGTAGSPGNYSGPMVHKDTDGRLYIRMQRPHPGKYSFGNKWSNHIWPGHPEAVSGGQIVYPVSQNPNNYVIHVFRVDTNVNCINSGGFFQLGNGINTLGYHFMSGQSNLKFGRGVDLTWHSWAAPSGQTNWFANRRRMSDGSKLHLSRAEWKFNGWLESGFRTSFIEGGGGTAGNNYYFKDCTICDYHELGVGGGSQGHWRWKNCTIWHILDDGLQVGPGLTRVAFEYCFFLASAFGGYQFSDNDPNPGGWFMHHCILDAREERGLEWRAHTPPKFLYSPHSPNGTQPRKIYNNTVFWGCDLEQEDALGFGHLSHGGSARNTTAVCHEVFNNICIRQVWNGKRYDGTTGYTNTGDRMLDYAWGKDTRFHPDWGNELWDYNLHYRDLDGTTALNSFVFELIGIGSPAARHSFASLAAWRASAQFTQSKAAGADRGAYSPGVEGNGTDVKPTLPSLDNFPTDRFKYRPAATAAVTTASSGSLSGANWWSPSPSWGTAHFNWTGLAPSPWKGALDPNGSTIPVGVQNP